MQARVKHNLSKWLSLPKLPPVKSSGQSNVKLKFYGYSLSELKQLEVDHEQDSTIILFSNEDGLLVAHTFVLKALLWPVSLRCTKMAIVGPNTLANTGLRVDSRTASISSPWHYLAVPATRMMQLGGFPGMWSIGGKRKYAAAAANIRESEDALEHELQIAKKKEKDLLLTSVAVCCKPRAMARIMQEATVAAVLLLLCIYTAPSFQAPTTTNAAQAHSLGEKVDAVETARKLSDAKKLHRKLRRRSTEGNTVNEGSDSSYAQQQSPSSEQSGTPNVTAPKYILELYRNLSNTELLETTQANTIRSLQTTSKGKRARFHSSLTMVICFQQICKQCLVTLKIQYGCSTITHWHDDKALVPNKATNTNEIVFCCQRIVL